MKVPKVEKTKTGYYIRLRLNGVSVPVRAATKTECIQQARLLKAQYSANKRELAAFPQDETLDHAIDRYIEKKRTSLSPSTIRNYRIIRENRFQSVMDEPLRNIKNWQTVYNNELVIASPKTLKNAIGLIKAVYADNGIQFPKIETAPIPKTERPFLDADQIKLFCETLKGETCEIAALLALSSLRCSELLALRWENVDLKNKRVLVTSALVKDEAGNWIEKKTNKTEASHRYVPIFIPQLYDALNAVEDKQGRVVDFAPHGLFCAINRVCRKAGVPETGIHGLRHSFAALCAVHLQVPEEIAMQIGGWSDFSTMRKIYTHVSQMDLNSKTAKFEAFFASKSDENAK